MLDCSCEGGERLWGLENMDAWQCFHQHWLFFISKEEDKDETTCIVQAPYQLTRDVRIMCMLIWGDCGLLSSSWRLSMHCFMLGCSCTLCSVACAARDLIQFARIATQKLSPVVGQGDSFISQLVPDEVLTMFDLHMARKMVPVQIAWARWVHALPVLHSFALCIDSPNSYKWDTCFGSHNRFAIWHSCRSHSIHYSQASLVYNVVLQCGRSKTRVETARKHYIG
jgi:hypothetical protein